MVKKELVKVSPNPADVAMRAEIVATIGFTRMTVAEVAQLTGISKGKVSYALREAVERGELVASKVVNATGSGAVNAYRRAE